MTVHAAALDDARQAYQQRRFDAVAGLLAPALADPAQAAEALLLLGRTQVYQGQLEAARQSVMQAQAKGLTGDRSRDAELTLQYISEALAEAAATPKDVTYQITAYTRAEFADGLGRDYAQSALSVPKRESDWRARLGTALGVDIPAGQGVVSLGMGLDELRYLTFHEMNEANIRGSARYLHRFDDLVSATLSYDALMTTVADHDRYSMVHRVGASTSFRHYRSEDGAMSLIGRIGFDTSFATFHSAHPLDSTTHALSLSDQLRFREPSTWIAPSLTVATSDADRRQYSYELLRLMIAGQTRLGNLGLEDELSRDVLLRGSVGRTYLDFRGKDSIQTTQVRFDVQDSLAVGLTKPLTDWVSLIFDASVNFNKSNLERYDYETKVISAGLHLTF